jgi:TonB family protein
VLQFIVKAYFKVAQTMQILKAVALGCSVFATAAMSQTDYKRLVGQSVRVCGRVVTYTDEGDDCGVRLDLGHPYWAPKFYVVVPGNARARFSTPPENAYLHQDVCVVGSVKADKDGVPHIVSEQPSQFEVTKNRDVKVFGAGLHRDCGPVRRPKLLKEVQPNYSREGIAARIQGRVLLDAIVGIKGQVDDLRIVYGLEASLDHEAREALKKWRFEPAVLNGVAVPAIVQVEMSFALRK